MSAGAQAELIGHLIVPSHGFLRAINPDLELNNSRGGIARRVSGQGIPGLSQMQARTIPGPWAAGERILVCISEDPRAAGLVRYAKRLSDRLHAPSKGSEK